MGTKEEARVTTARGKSTSKSNNSTSSSYNRKKSNISGLAKHDW